ncbi:hypothetical protein B0H66DRAFT_545238 [Apodospora peruviana]|uniref:Uncharacterized protein n=1 Tax=Apodospora peruviana TaxID=516989 RepID=A0AAE0MFR8_9PEZI|nr:hypothetical protein B0H66DRAFT_545238 [Apodospora peruviana]
MIFGSSRLELFYNPKLAISWLFLLFTETILQSSLEEHLFLSSFTSHSQTNSDPKHNPTSSGRHGLSKVSCVRARPVCDDIGAPNNPL